MYVRGYLQGSENGRVVTIDVKTRKRGNVVGIDMIRNNRIDSFAMLESGVCIGIRSVSHINHVTLYT